MDTNNGVMGLLSRTHPSLCALFRKLPTSPRTGELGNWGTRPCCVAQRCESFRSPRWRPPLSVNEPLPPPVGGLAGESGLGKKPGVASTGRATLREVFWRWGPGPVSGLRCLDDEGNEWFMKEPVCERAFDINGYWPEVSVA